MLTNEIMVVSVSEDGVRLAINGENKFVTWSLLDSACGQDDAALRAKYQSIDREARSMAADGPVTVEVTQDHTNVWWIVSVGALYGGGLANWGRAADEGGTHPNHLCASLEAAHICDRLGKRVARRIGFDSAKARARAAAVTSKKAD